MGDEGNGVEKGGDKGGGVRGGEADGSVDHKGDTMDVLVPFCIFVHPGRPIDVVVVDWTTLAVMDVAHSSLLGASVPFCFSL